VHAQECSSRGERSSKGEEGLRKRIDIDIDIEHAIVIVMRL